MHRQHIRESDPAARSGAWAGRIRVGCLAGAGVAGTPRPGG